MSGARENWRLTPPRHNCPLIPRYQPQLTPWVPRARLDVKGHRVQSVLSPGHQLSLIGGNCPRNTRRWPKVGLMLAHRLRRWPNNNPTSGQRLVFAGTWSRRSVYISCLFYRVFFTLSDVFHIILWEKGCQITKRWSLDLSHSMFV